MCSAGQLLVVPSYFDYVRVRNFLAGEEDVTFAALHEYASVSDLARGRSLFADGRWAMPGSRPCRPEPYCLLRF